MRKLHITSTRPVAEYTSKLHSKGAEVLLSLPRNGHPEKLLSREPNNVFTRNFDYRQISALKLLTAPVDEIITTIVCSSILHFEHGDPGSRQNKDGWSFLSLTCNRIAKYDTSVHTTDFHTLFRATLAITRQALVIPSLVP